MNVLKCILVQKVGFVKYKLGLLHVYKMKFKIYKNLILPVVLYGCETWLLILKVEQRLKLLKNRVLRKICGPTLGLSGKT